MSVALRSLSDQEIINRTETLVTRERKITLALLQHLHEIERRKLYLKRGFSSMYDYCTSHLKLSEGSAMRRIKTSRCLARFPQLHALLESGEVNLMTVTLVSRILRPQNAEALIARIRGKSKRQVEAIVAEHEPRALLPPDRVQPVMIPAAAAVSADRFTATGGGKESSSVGESSATPALECYSNIQFTARQEFMAKVERARAVVWHLCPHASFELLFEMGLDELIKRRDPRERKKRREQRATSARKAHIKAGKRYVPAALRDQVFARAEFRCSYVGPDGRRCTATVALQVDHVVPVAHGGASTADNLRILCAEHNRLEAERLMGARGSSQRANAP